MSEKSGTDKGEVVPIRGVPGRDGNLTSLPRRAKTLSVCSQVYVCREGSSALLDSSFAESGGDSGRPLGECSSVAIRLAFETCQNERVEECHLVYAFVAWNANMTAYSGGTVFGKYLSVAY